MNDREEMFALYLESQGKAFAYEPICFKLKKSRYTPDFYCPDDNTFYEVIGTRQALHMSRAKIIRFLNEYPEIKFKLVRPDGKNYIMNDKNINLIKVMKAKNPRARIQSTREASGEEKTKALVMRIPESWAIKIKEIATSECRTEASVYRQAIKAFLDEKK